MIKQWYTFTEAGEKLGKSKSYFQSHYKKNPNYFKEGTFRKSGRLWLISDEGIEHVLSHVKKSGVLLRNSVLRWTAKQKLAFAFTRLVLLYVILWRSGKKCYISICFIVW